jgi:hypothetical protein
MRELEFYIHPGYGKTGTSFLQEKIFSRIGFTNLGKIFSNNRLKEYQYKVFKPKYTLDPIYPFNIQEDLKDYILEIEKTIDNSNINKIIFSDEVLFDKINYFGDYNIYLLKEIIEKLREKYKINLNFIVTIRNQSDVIAPTFAYNYHRQKKNFKTVDNYIRQILNDKNLAQIFYYNELINKIKKHFSPKILILPYEELVENFDNYVKKLENFLNMSFQDINLKNEFVNKNHIIQDGEKSWHANDIKISNIYLLASSIHRNLKKKNTYYKKFHSKLNFIKKIITPKTKKVGLIKISLEQKNLLKKHFKDSNKKLASDYDIDLERLGYF